ncbi:MAG: GNAT family N-acetyltransferase [Planctomycetota bacterium]
MLLWHGDEPIGICMTGPPVLNSSARNAAFGLRGLTGPAYARLINDNFATVARLVLDPRYRGAGIGARLLRRAAEMTDRSWVELASEMANLVPFAAAAGFRLMGRGRDKLRAAPFDDGCWYGRKKNRRQSWPGFLRRVRFSRPAYYVFDNRNRVPPSSGA